MSWITRCPQRIQWIITKVLILEQHLQGVNAEAINATVKPEAHHAIHLLAHPRIAPVEIRLFHIIDVQVVLPAAFIELPSRPIKPAGPVIRRTTIGGGVAPDIPIALLVRAAGSRFHKPGMLIRGMVGTKSRMILRSR